MNKRIVVSVVICVILLGIIGWIIVSQNYKKTVEISSKQEPAVEEKIDSPEKITIYDIEEGYMEVPFNKSADLHSYDWSKLNKNGGYYKYEDDKYTSKLGLDVSSHQKDINWQKVKAAGVDFVIIRLGYRGYGKSGKIVLDEYFEKNYEGARAVGIDVGVYFFSQAINMDEVKEEADFVFKHIDGKEISYPVVYDLEKIKNDTARTDNLTQEEITNMTLEFCKLVEKKGYIASVYGNSKTFTTKMELERFNEYNKWYAGYPEAGGYDYPFYPYEFDIWQYTETGAIDGVTGNVDINIQFVEKEL